MQRAIGQPIEREYRLIDLLRRPEVHSIGLTELRDLDGPLVSAPASDVRHR